MGDNVPPEMVEMRMSYNLGRIAPPGTAERLVAAMQQLGTYLVTWRSGSVIRLHPGPDNLEAKLMVEMKKPPKDAPVENYELVRRALTRGHPRPASGARIRVAVPRAPQLRRADARCVPRIQGVVEAAS